MAARIKIVKFLLLFIFLFIAKNCRASDLVFNYQVIDPAPPSANGCCLEILTIGDLDKDNKSDILVGSQNAEGLVWYRNPAWEKYIIASGNFSGDAKIADIDKDGDNDIISSQANPNQIGWWENTGNPTISTGWVFHKIGDIWAHDLILADLNKDANIDIVTNSPGLTSGWWQAPVNPLNAWTFHEITMVGEGLDSADIDSDGDTDLAQGRNWLENTDGNGLAWNTHQISSDWSDNTKTLIADMDSDMDKDIVLTYLQGFGRVSWFENPGWAEHAIDSASLQDAHTLASADFDMDGNTDIFTGEINSSFYKRIMVYQNLDKGKSWQKIEISRTGIHNGQTADVNGDGKIDLIGKNLSGIKVLEMWQNNTQPSVPVSPSPSGNIEPSPSASPSPQADPGCIADLSKDGIVNLADIAIILIKYAQRCTQTCREDLNNDTLISLADINIVLKYWGTSNCPLN